MTFQVGEKIAHPLHGAGIIERVERRRIDGVERDYYVLKIPVGNMDVMIPCETCEKVGVRHLLSAEEIESIFFHIPEIETNSTANWNKRYRENMELVKSGDLLKVASVIKGLVLRDEERGLSTGERKVLHSAMQIVISEVVLSTGMTEEEAQKKLSECLH